MQQDSLTTTILLHHDSVAAIVAPNLAAPEAVDLTDLANTHGSTYANTPARPAADTLHTSTDSLVAAPDTLNSTLRFDKLGFFNGSRWVNQSRPVHFVGISGDLIPYKLSNDIYVTSTLLLCLFMAGFLIGRSINPLRLQLKNFFHTHNRNASFLLKSEGEVKHHIFIILLESFVLSLLFFSYMQFKHAGQLTTISPYLPLLADMGICTAYFAIKYALLGTFNWTFFNETRRETWFTGYNLIIFGKAITLLPLVLVVMYFNLSLEVCIYAFLAILTAYEALVFYKTRQIFFNRPLGLLPSFLYFCTLEMLPLLFLWEILTKTHDYLLA